MATSLDCDFCDSSSDIDTDIDDNIICFKCYQSSDFCDCKRILLIQTANKQNHNTQYLKKHLMQQLAHSIYYSN